MITKLKYLKAFYTRDILPTAGLLAGKILYTETFGLVKRNQFVIDLDNNSILHRTINTNSVSYLYPSGITNINSVINPKNDVDIFKDYPSYRANEILYFVDKFEEAAINSEAAITSYLNGLYNKVGNAGELDTDEYFDLYNNSISIVNDINTNQQTFQDEMPELGPEQFDVLLAPLATKMNSLNNLFTFYDNYATANTQLLVDQDTKTNSQAQLNNRQAIHANLVNNCNDLAIFIINRINVLIDLINQGLTNSEIDPSLSGTIELITNNLVDQNVLLASFDINTHSTNDLNSIREYCSALTNDVLSNTSPFMDDLYNVSAQISQNSLELIQDINTYKQTDSIIQALTQSIDELTTNIMLNVRTKAQIVDDVLVYLD